MTSQPGPTATDATTTDATTTETGDLVIDGALGELTALPAEDLDGILGAAESLHRTLQGRLSDLGE